MTDLTDLRQQIDEIDARIVELYEKRMEISGQVAQYKIETGKKVFDKAREEEKIRTVKALTHNDFNRHGIEELFEQIMSMSRKLQYRLLSEHGSSGKLPFIGVDSLSQGKARVVFQGAEGAYSQAAMIQYFGEQVNSFHVESWREAMEAIRDGQADYAVLPIENSTAGVVAENYDLLIEYDNYIVGEQIIPIRHCLLGLKEAELSDITSVYSHPQALAQCERYLQAHEDWDCATEGNTAVAACKVKKSGNKHKAAIASELTAKLYGLKILERNIQTSSENSTRFIIVTNRKIFLKDAAKMSICLEVKHQSGSLYHALSHIIYNDLNMNFIQSRPLNGPDGTNWQYRFFIDFAGNLNESAVSNALRGLSEECESIRVLGNY